MLKGKSSFLHLWMIEPGVVHLTIVRKYSILVRTLTLFALNPNNTTQPDHSNLIGTFKIRSIIVLFASLLDLFWSQTENERKFLFSSSGKKRFNIWKIGKSTPGSTCSNNWMASLYLNRTSQKLKVNPKHSSKTQT